MCTCTKDRALQGRQLALNGLELARGQLLLQVRAQLLHRLRHLLHLRRVPLLQLLRCPLPGRPHLQQRGLRTPQADQCTV